MIVFHVERESIAKSPDMTRGTLHAPPLRYPTLELPWLGNAPRVSCVPAGRYPCVIAWSGKFQRFMPRLHNVPGRRAILFHALNSVSETEGCIGIGSINTPTGIGRSKLAFEAFLAWLGLALQENEVICEITQRPDAPTAADTAPIVKPEEDE